jgi:hypothetical protein
LSDVSGSSSDESNDSKEDKECEDEDSTDEIESESKDDIDEEDLSRRATASIENVGPETGVNEETYISVPTQELQPPSNGEDDGNPMPDFVDYMPDAARSEPTVQLEDVGG